MGASVETKIVQLLRADRWREVLQEYDRLARQAPTADACGLLALTSFRAGLPAEAATWLDRGARGIPPSYWLEIARCTLSSLWEQRLPSALSGLRELTAAFPRQGEAWIALKRLTPDPAERLAAEQALRSLPTAYPESVFWGKVEGDHSVSATPSDDFIWASPRRDATTIPLRRDARGMLWLEAVIDGAPMRLLYDTGAGRHLFLVPSALKRLSPIRTEPTRLMGLQGASNAILARCRSLRLRGLELHSLPVESAPANLGGFDGLLGWRTLGECCQRLDLEENTLTLSLRSTAPAEKRVSLPLHVFREHLLIPVRCRPDSQAHFPLWALLDTGAPDDFFSLALAQRLAQGLPRSLQRHETVSFPIGIGTAQPRVDLLSFQRGFALTSGTGAPLTLYAEGRGASFLDRVHNPATGFEHGILLGMDFISRFRSLELDLPASRLHLGLR